MARRTASSKSSEVDAYLYIKNELRQLGWDVRNPARHPQGQVYTQNECLTHPEIKRCFGLQKPENVVKVTESVLWAIEAKRAHGQLDLAVKEAREYADLVNSNSSLLKVSFISGVAGNETDGYFVETRCLVDGQFVPVVINGKPVSAFLSPEIAHTVLTAGPQIRDVPVDEALFLSKAERINTILHLGAINKNQRARVMAALLLALIEDTPPNIDASPSVLINDINGRARRVLQNHAKPEFYRYIELALPATEDNHLKFKTALVQTIQELNNLNIRSAMNSGNDVLGKFYEVFLKYGNGAKEIGIVLTPRHITKFAVEALGVTDRDVIYDPTCGTGGFLVAAFDYVRQHTSAAQVDLFKQFSLFGVEQEPEVVALAIVNMIFRGDGKTNIVEGNCFQKNLVSEVSGKITTARYSNLAPRSDETPVTKVLMNPPFALKASDEEEFRFIDQALKQMRDGGLLFSVLPYSTMVKPGEYKAWRKRLLGKHTLLSVVTFPADLFYPIGVHTVGVFIKEGVPQPRNQNVLWIRAINDGMLKRKGKRLPDPKAMNDYPRVMDLLKAFLQSPALAVPNIDQLQKACPIDFTDPLLELVPENYLDQSPPTEEEVRAGIERTVRNAVAFLVKAGKENEYQV